MVSVTIKAILPKRKFSSEKWARNIATAQRQTSIPILRQLFLKTVFGWSKKPSMGWVQTRTNDDITIQIYAKGEGADIWNLLNEGSPAHPIYPKKHGGMLRFRPGYRAATTPGSIQSKRAYRSGKPISTPFVQHPGFIGRNFTQLIAQEYAMNYAMDMQKAITKAARQK